MNDDHAKVCSSEEWALYLRDEVMPRALGDLDLGAANVLEIGPGYGAATRWLISKADRLTAVEPDVELADSLERNFPKVSVFRCSGAKTPFDDASFDAVACFTMLHHVPTLREQDAILTETTRILRAGGVFVGSDSVASPRLVEFHRGDTYNPVDPATLEQRLENVGLTNINVSVTGDERRVLTFHAARPR